MHIFSGSVKSSTDAGLVILEQNISAVDPDGLSSTLTYKITPENTMFSLNDQQGKYIYWSIFSINDQQGKDYYRSIFLLNDQQGIDYYWSMFSLNDQQGIDYYWSMCLLNDQQGIVY